MYSPLAYWDAKNGGKRVGIIGIGGLGQMGVSWHYDHDDDENYEDYDDDEDDAGYDNDDDRCGWRKRWGTQ